MASFGTVSIWVGIETDDAVKALIAITELVMWEGYCENPTERLDKIRTILQDTFPKVEARLKKTTDGVA